MEIMNRILQWNVRGVRSRHQDISVLIKEQNPSCLCLQELKLPNNTKYNIGNHYKSYFKLPNDNETPKGGTLIAIKTNISHHHIQLNTDLQAVAVSLTSGKIKSLCSVYLPPDEIITEDQLDQLIDQLPRPTLIVGDFNAHNPLWYDRRLDHRGEVIQGCMDVEELVVLNEDCPTYYRSHDQATSSIDLTLVTNTCAPDFNWNILDDLNGSDHYPILVSAQQPSPPDYTEKYNLNKADWNKYKDHSKTTTKATEIPNIDQVFEHIKNTIITASNKVIPKTRVNKTLRPCLPWWTPECRVERSKVRSAFKTMKRNPNPTTIRTYRRRLAIKVRTYRQAKQKSWREYISTLTAKTPSSKIWKKIRKLSGKYIPKPYPNLKQGQTTITSQKEVAEVFVRHYAQISTAKDEHKIPQKVDLDDNPNNLAINQNFSMSELEDSLRRLEEGRSSGEDRIDNAMLKNLPSISKQFLLDFFNRIWNEGSFPADWKTSIILPILKTGKDQSNPKNYRPISLTSNICKLLEKIVNTRLIWFLENNQKLSPQQFGFRPGRSTIEPIAALTTDILNGFKERKTTTAVFFDFEKAFDTISRHTIISNLKEIGVTGNMLKFIHNYLQGRSVKVKIGNILSDKHMTTAGVPQGGVLSATCFIVAINTILHTLHTDVKGSLYADDLVIYHTSRIVRTSSRLLQNTIQRLEDWARNVGLKFSPMKSEVVHFWRDIKGGATRDYPTLKLYNKEIPTKDTTKFLGMILDRGLNFESHIQSLKGETYRALNILRMVSGINFGADRKTLMRLYWAVGRSKLEYGSQVYSSAKPSTLKKLDPVNNEALRICTGAFRSSPAVSLQVEAGSPPLDLQREEQLLKYLLKLETHPEYSSKLNILDEDHDLKYDGNDQHMVPVGTKARKLKQRLEFDPDPVQGLVAETPPWQLNKIKICREGTTNTKKNTSALHIKQNFLSHLANHSDTMHIYTDGSKSQNGVGFGVVYGHNHANRAMGTLPGEASIFTAELHAIVKALSIIENSIYLNWTIFSDSQSSIQAISQQNPKHPLVQRIQAIISKLHIQRKKISLCKVPSHVGIPGNEAADRAANEGQNLPGIHTTRLPHTDYHPQIRSNMMKKWQQLWDQIDNNALTENKLKKSKPKVKPLKFIPGGNRKYEVKITRLRIGHTRLTHGHYMSRGRPPECTLCGMSPLTTEHFLTNCQMTFPLRNQLKLPNNPQKLLGEECPVASLIEYLQKTGILEEI